MEPNTYDMKAEGRLDDGRRPEDRDREYKEQYVGEYSPST